MSMTIWDEDLHLKLNSSLQKVELLYKIDISFTANAADDAIQPPEGSSPLPYLL